MTRFLWPYTLLPIGLIVAIDYIEILGGIAQLLLGIWVGLQLLSFLAGFAIAAWTHLHPTSPWSELKNMNLWKFFPLIGAGWLSFTHLIDPIDAPSTPTPSTPDGPGGKGLSGRQR